MSHYKKCKLPQKKYSLKVLIVLIIPKKEAAPKRQPLLIL
jgi:hypothetical protein